jgi:hypothetical protein
VGHVRWEAWEKAIEVCGAFLRENPTWDMDIVFAVLSDEVLQMGKEQLKTQM